MGRVIARQAVEAGHQVVVASRHPERARDLLVKGIKVCKADITTGKGLNHAIKGCDTVINLVGLLFSSGTNTFETAHQNGSKNIIKACDHAGVTQILHMSALLTHNAIQNTEYGISKHGAEVSVRNSNLNWTIFRPSIIFGENDSFLMRFKQMSSILPVLPVISGGTKFQPIWVEDVARAFVLSIGNAQVSKQTITLAGNEVYSFKDMLNMWMAALGRNKQLIDLPDFAASILASVSSLLPTPLITSDQLKLLKSDNVAPSPAFPSIFGQAASFESLLPSIASGGQAQSLQCKLDQARTHYRKS